MRMTSIAMLVLLLATPVAAAGADAPLSYQFHQDGLHYTFSATFTVEATPAQVIGILFPVESLQQYSRRGGTVELIDQGPGWQVVRLTHASWFWTFTAVVRREIACSGRCIQFRMLSARRTGLPIPVPTGSSGEYRVDPSADGVRVTFTQSVDAPDTIFLGPWISLAKSKAVALARDLETFLRGRLEMGTVPNYS